MSFLSTNTWFYIQSTATGHVVSASTSEEPLRSQVYVCQPKQIDEELWQWDGRFIVNKATDIKTYTDLIGRLRLIEDTEVCLYTKKAVDEAHNQMWGVKEDEVDLFGRKQEGTFIYSHCNDDWVLDIQPNADGATKLILLPLQSIDNDNQRWSFIPHNESEHPLSPPSLLFSTSASSVTPCNSLPSTPVFELSLNEYANALSPCKRGSQSSVTSISLEFYKECHQMVYLEGNPRLSDKAIAMAAAYQTWQHWRHEHLVTSQPIAPDYARSQLQLLVQEEASIVYAKCDQLSNHKETALSLASRLVLQLYDNPTSP
ncbi:hypothetical protein BDF14DRAFT_1857213 [Spinellus fusiger]|nr:hypothetical protein BDF14DRAFT_1857213 [Spinellus fusiger]